jgi:thiol-disulfide isomerase/thioredoxin
MDKSLRVILVITIASALSMGLVMSGCSGESGQDMAGVSIITSVSSGSAADLYLGGPAPDFWFETAEGQSTSLSDFKGKIVLINFWATWCTYCRMQMPYIEQIYEEWSGEELVVLAINVGESPEDVTSFMQSQGFTHPVLLDSEGQVATRYGASALPATIFIDKEGLIQYGVAGAFSSVEEIESILHQLE